MTNVRDFLKIWDRFINLDMGEDCNIYYYLDSNEIISIVFPNLCFSYEANKFLLQHLGTSVEILFKNMY